MIYYMSFISTVVFYSWQLLEKANDRRLKIVGLKVLPPSPGFSLHGLGPAYSTVVSTRVPVNSRIPSVIHGLYEIILSKKTT